MYAAVGVSAAKGTSSPPALGLAAAVSSGLTPGAGALAEAMGDYGPMAYLGAVLGLRWGGCAGLRVGRLDLLRSTLEVAEHPPGGREAAW